MAARASSCEGCDTAGAGAASAPLGPASLSTAGWMSDVASRLTAGVDAADAGGEAALRFGAGAALFFAVGRPGAFAFRAAAAATMRARRSAASALSEDPAAAGAVPAFVGASVGAGAGLLSDPSTRPWLGVFPPRLTAFGQQGLHTRTGSAVQTGGSVSLPLEQLSHTTSPHMWQWYFHVVKPKPVLQQGHLLRWSFFTKSFSAHGVVGAAIGNRLKFRQ
mmetsp:Transcript_54805/g.168929  ORF Transcript_54805/g.168929 Transcript_54805/m.168929 type:complete len:220 (-) Transcript_54805:19-678(-)|eukprot:CAMPEP_0174833828 /NCGR_PEP_ID=MMETSP1114-20130205/4473_1 /TAXON_ID=312471 /ORGANISM="Neobodo designis, Strain CCAP 1951/1" /LENGTH=219 /DNA_ID=CAMNT_0016067725 /DNA_START=272 /DNA_END=931 /DNA_ORIENTATION=-